MRDLTGHFLQFSEQEYRKRPNPFRILPCVLRVCECG